MYYSWHYVDFMFLADPTYNMKDGTNGPSWFFSPVISVLPSWRKSDAILQVLIFSSNCACSNDNSKNWRYGEPFCLKNCEPLLTWIYLTLYIPISFLLSHFRPLTQYILQKSLWWYYYYYFFQSLNHVGGQNIKV